MSDTTQGDTESGRKAIAKREWIDENGDHTPDRSKSVGARYTYLKTGGSIERVFGDAGDATTMCACMGWMTKVGNIVNSIVNADDYDGSDPMPDVKDWDEQLGKGIWREAGEGAARGPKYDKDVLAAALLAELAGNAKGDIAHYRERLDDKSYYAKVRANLAVMARYTQEMASRQKEIASADALA